MYSSVGVESSCPELAQWGLIESPMKVMRPAIHFFALLACLVLAAGCASDGTTGMRLTRAQAQLRFADVQQLATEHATEEGLEASFASREIKGNRVLMHNCVVVFTHDNTSVAATDGEINEGVFTFRGTPVLKVGSVLKIGDQLTVITATPGGDHHYAISVRGKPAMVAE